MYLFMRVFLCMSTLISTDVACDIRWAIVRRVV